MGYFQLSNVKLFQQKHSQGTRVSITIRIAHSEDHLGLFPS